MIIPAGGKGKRLKSNTPKQFLPLNSKPIICHVTNAFRAYERDIKIILVLPKNHIDFWNRLCNQLDCEFRSTVVEGGATRYDSVKAGLNLVPEDALVAVHDGVRPFPSVRLIKACFETAKKKGSAIPCIDIPDSIRKINTEGSQVVDRSFYKLIQTPQCFLSQWLHAAYKQPYRDTFTDDASLIEAQGYPIHLVKGETGNIKITTSYDLEMAKFISQQREALTAAES